MSESLPTPARRDRRRLEEGQGMVEYALILVLIAVVAAVMLTFLGHSTNTLFSNISNALGS
jgi:pilus assembly protein Flp/PilA